MMSGQSLQPLVILKIFRITMIRLPGENLPGQDITGCTATLNTVSLEGYVREWVPTGI